jgi:hypothetical protein
MHFSEGLAAVQISGKWGYIDKNGKTVVEPRSLSSQAIEHVRAIWDAMRHKSAGFPLGHDGYLKLWALSRPKAQVDYVMVDEAQDLNPVILGVLRSMKCPVIYVGDPYQQIYEWRGAINAMEQIVSRHRVLLSQSFRFGKAIADAASVIIRQLGAKDPVRGLDRLDSHLARVRPNVILARSNAGVMGSILYCLQNGIRCHVLGGTRDLERVLEDVRRVKQRTIAQSPELLGFHSWKDVMSFSVQPEGEYLRGLVKPSASRQRTNQLMHSQLKIYKVIFERQSDKNLERRRFPHDFHDFYRCYPRYIRNLIRIRIKQSH